jgi:WD repeat-containing protein 81
MKPLSAWLSAATGDNGASDEALCRCHKIFETEDDWGVHGDMQTIAQIPSSPYNTNLSDELGPEESKGGVSSPLRPQQQFFGDLRKWPLRERRLKRHQVGTTYRADVADFRIRFLALQLFHAVDFCHSRNVTLGDQLSPDKIFVQKDGWVRIVPPIAWKDVKNDVPQTTEMDSIPQPPLVMNGPKKDWRTIFHRQHGNSADATTSPSHAGYSDSIIPYIGYGDSPTLQWQKGLLTNLSYLMILNAAAGRTVGNQLNPPMLPWVTNFAGEIDLRPDNIGNLLSEKSPYWRDLSRSKFRLTKGDDQLDHTFQNLRHHIPETLSEITYTVYRARALPIHQLRSTIRQDFIAEHYPESIKKLYEWSPDEASIDFFVTTTPCPFKSLHKEMQDITLPSWCENTSDFINYHRHLLESEYVSKHLHLWIDLNFGEALTGARAVAEKNVPLYSSRKLDKHHHVCQGDCHSVLSGAPEEKELRVESSSLKSLFVQLFDHRHPKKHSNLQNALRTKIHTAVNRERETVNKADSGKRSKHDLTARRKRDISLVGVLLNECYNAARVIPSPDVQSAITNLLYGSFDLHLSLNEQTATGKVFPFPKHMKEAYSILSRAQTLTLWRLPSDDASDENTLTIRSTGLEQVGNLIRNSNTNFIDDLPVSAIGLILPTLLQPLSLKYLEENCASSRPFSSFAENLCNYLVALSNKVPGDVLLPRLLQFLQSSSDGVGITEQLSKFFLSRPLIASMYSSSEAEYFVSKICRFLFKQLCAQEEDREIVLDRNTVGVFFTSLLAQDDVLGTSICCHYIIPLLVDNIELCSNRSCGNMIVKSIKSMLPFLPEDIIGVIICKKILRKIVPKVLSRRGATNVDNIEDVIFLTELMILLQHCLRHLGSENVVKYFFHTNSGSISDALSSSLNWTLCSANSTTECDRSSSYEELLEAARILVCGMFRQIESHQLPFTILPLLDSFCGLVNDSHLTNVLNESVLPRDGEQKEEILSLPGVKDANAMLQEAFKVRDQEELKATCPSVADFLAFLNPPAERTQKGDKNEAIDIQKQVTAQVEKDSTLKSDGVASLYRSISLSTNKNKIREPSDSTNGSSIEMLPSIDRSASKESVAENSTKIQRKAPYLLRNVSSFSRSSMDVQEKRHDKEKLDLVWLLGLHKQDKDEQIKYSWQPRLMLSAKLDIGKSSESDDSKVHIDCMTKNQSESMLACGNSDGELLIFDLRRHPPALRTRHRIRHIRQKDEPVTSIHQVEFLEGGDLLACDGGIHLVDVEAQSTISSLSPENAFISDQGGKPWKSEVIHAFSPHPRSTGSAEILCGSMGEICAISSAYLYGIDMRCSGAITSRNSVVAPYKHTSQSDALFKSVSWYTGIVATKENSQSSRPSHKKSHQLAEEQESSFNFTCVTSYSGGGDWICVGSSSGHIHCIDRRRGKILACWRAHQKAIIYIKSISRYKVLSASADKTAVLWNIMSSPPQKISTIYNIPGKEHSMNVTSHQFREDGLVSIPGGDLILCAVTGRKAVFMAIPTELKPDGSAWEVKADRVVMSDCEGNPIPSSEKLRVSSVALLPCRQLVLLGCEGEIHVCL